MSVLEVCCVFLAGMAAGAINAIVGSGTLITFPTLLLFGYPPVAANMTNALGMVTGSVAGAVGYRAELVDAGRTLRRLIPMSLVGSIIGAFLLLWLPPEAFEVIVPVLIVVGLLLVVLGPRLQKAAAARHTDRPVRWHTPAMMAGVLATGVYGGYFGAAQGVILMGLLSALSAESLQRLNGYKNVLAAIVNAVAAVTFVLVAGEQILWTVAAVLAVGALIGGWLGARIGRRLNPLLLRSVIVVVGLVAIVVLLA